MQDCGVTLQGRLCDRPFDSLHSDGVLHCKLSRQNVGYGMVVDGFGRISASEFWNLLRKPEMSEFLVLGVGVL